MILSVCSDMGFLKLHDAASAECWFSWTVDPTVSVFIPSLCGLYNVYIRQSFMFSLQFVYLQSSYRSGKNGILLIREVVEKQKLDRKSVKKLEKMQIPDRTIEIKSFR